MGQKQSYTQLITVHMLNHGMEVKRARGVTEVMDDVTKIVFSGGMAFVFRRGRQKRDVQRRWLLRERLSTKDMWERIMRVQEYEASRDSALEKLRCTTEYTKTLVLGKL